MARVRRNDPTLDHADPGESAEPNPYRGAAPVGLAGGFILAKGPYGEAAHLDDRLRAHVATEQDDIDTLGAAWEALRAVALPTTQTLTLIKEAAATWQT